MKKSFYTKMKCAVRKWMSAKVIPHMVLNGSRIFFYRLCGYNIGKNVFIGMRCYLDDLEPRMLTIEDNVTVSYGVYMACHGKNQDHYPITIKEGAYVGMRANIITKNIGGGYFRYSHREKCYSRSLYSCQSGCSGWSNSGWRTLQNYREIGNHRNEVVAA